MKLTLLAAALLVAGCYAAPKKSEGWFHPTEPIPDYKFKTPNIMANPNFLGPTKPRKANPRQSFAPTQSDDCTMVENLDFCDAEKVVGGEEACPHQFPWLATVLCDSGGWLCTGSFIYSNWVMTAGHCVLDCTQFTIYAGAHSRSQAAVDPNVQAIRVSSTGSDFALDNYNPAFLVNDIGLIPLSEDVDSNLVAEGRVRYSCLPARADQNNQFEDQFSTVTGWGKLCDGNQPECGAADTVHFARDRRILANADCPYGIVNAPDPNTGEPLNAVVCIDVSDGSGVCNGDSGGPLNLQPGGAEGAYGGPYTQIGVTSFVSSAGCESGIPHGFARVTTYLDAIQTRTGIPIP